MKKILQIFLVIVFLINIQSCVFIKANNTKQHIEIRWDFNTVLKSVNGTEVPITTIALLINNEKKDLVLFKKRKS